jgi:hypothetical protein
VVSHQWRGDTAKDEELAEAAGGQASGGVETAGGRGGVFIGAEGFRVGRCERC